jgi:hypothetical protein
MGLLTSRRCPPHTRGVPAVQAQATPIFKEVANGSISQVPRLVERGIINSWPDLKDAVENRGFPAGRMASKRKRIWLETEVDSWAESLPSAIEAKPPLLGGAKLRAEAKRARLAREAGGGEA